MTTVVITGGAGFIGSHLCDRLLAEGKRVVAVDDLSAGHIANLAEARSYGKQFTFHNLDIRAEGLARILESHRPEVVVHLAARREHGTKLDPIADAGVAVMGLLNVLEASVASGARKLVFASSASIYGEVRRLPVRESSAPSSRPLTPSAITKKLAEDYLRFYGRYRGLDHTILVLPAVYGPRQYPADGAGIVGRVAGAMLSGESPRIPGDGNQTRDFLFVDDAVHAFSLALPAERAPGRLVNVGTGVETSVNGLCRMLTEITGFAGEPAFDSAPHGLVRRIALDNEVAERELAWKPWTHLEDGLRETVAFLRGA